MKKWLPTALLLSTGLLAYANNTTQNIRLNTDQQTFEVSLPANQTTGYTWFVQFYDHDLLSLEDYHYTNSPSTPGMVGTGGNATFTFSVNPSFYNAPQVTLISLVYEQPWNPIQHTNASILVSSTESSNNASAWQKYPSSTDGVPMPTTGTDNPSDAANWISLPSSTNS